MHENCVFRECFYKKGTGNKGDNCISRGGGLKNDVVISSNY